MLIKRKQDETGNGMFEKQSKKLRQELGFKAGINFGCKIKKIGGFEYRKKGYLPVEFHLQSSA